jgi:hypothetical protein
MKDRINKLLDALSEASIAASKCRQELNEISDEIRIIEGRLTELNLNFPFHMLLGDIDEEADWTLCWDKDSQSKRFRFILKVEVDFGDAIRRPLIEMNATIRSKCRDYLPLFLEEFTKYIESK